MKNFILKNNIRVNFIVSVGMIININYFNFYAIFIHIYNSVIIMDYYS